MTTLSQTARTFVLIHGASHGGWCYDRVAAILRSQGHQVFAPTLAGLAERASMDARQINLTTHIDEVVDLFEREDLNDVILCGHSYGGMVIAGVADRITDRIGHLVFLDSVLAESGKCMNDYVFPGWRLLPILLSVWLFGRGYKLTPPPPAWYFNVNKADRPMVNRRLTGHPFKTLTNEFRSETMQTALQNTPIFTPPTGETHRSPSSMISRRSAKAGKHSKLTVATTS